MRSRTPSAGPDADDSYLIKRMHPKHRDRLRRTGKKLRQHREAIERRLAD